MPAPVIASKPLHVLLPTLGSAGDVHPFSALGLALRARARRATIITNPFFQSLIERLGLRFLPVGTLADVDAAVTRACELVEGLAADFNGKIPANGNSHEGGFL